MPWTIHGMKGEEHNNPKVKALFPKAWRSRLIYHPPKPVLPSPATGRLPYFLSAPRPLILCPLLPPNFPRV